MSPPRGWDGARFPERAPRRPGSGPWRAKGKRPFGATWWGRAWIDAIEHRAHLDPNRLPRGRTYARTGAVGELDVRLGEIRAAVQGSRARPYDVIVRVRCFGDGEWASVFGLLSSQVGHLAALLDGELPSGVGEQLQAGGLDLLPGAGELEPSCSCPDWADPCKHSAAACYLVADLLDEDPFQLFVLRGRSREELLAELRARRSAASTGAPPDPELPDPELPGVAAREAWARASELPPLPPLPLPPPHPGKPAVLALDPPASSGLSAQALRELASDAAERAFELMHGTRSSGLELSFPDDLARRTGKPLSEGGKPPPEQ
ncbi:MAG: SWIM zinc finger family protein [Acidimicrobiales bacterium]